MTHTHMTHTTTLIKNGHIIDPATNKDGSFDILIQDGRIKAVKENIEKTADTIIDATNMLVVPGFVDIHVHLREPGREDKETLETGLRAALAGGVTSVVSMPNTTPITDSQSMVEFQIKRARELNLANLFPSGAITKESKGKELSHIWEMKNSGIVALSDDGFDVQNEDILRKAMEYAKTHNLVIMNHCEVLSLSGEGVMHEGIISTKLGLPGIPSISEELSVLKILMLAEYTGARVHITHVSTARSVELIAEYQKRGVSVSAETCPQYISLTDEACLGYNTLAKMYPPLRPAKDREGVIEGLKSGVLSVMATDHAPHTHFEKLQPFSQAAKGTVGLETSFAVAYTHLVKKNKLSLPNLIEKMTINPATVVNIPKGTLKEETEADLTIIDLKKKWKADISTMQTKGRNCVFDGMEMYGKVQHVFVTGVQKVENEKIVV